MVWEETEAAGEGDELAVELVEMEILAEEEGSNMEEGGALEDDEEEMDAVVRG